MASTDDVDTDGNLEDDDAGDFGDFEGPDWIPGAVEPNVAARLVNLVFLLSSGPRTLQEIRDRFASMSEYAGSPNTARQKFLRDKNNLKHLGIEVVEHDDSYHIATTSRALRRPLTPDETAAVALASRRVLPVVAPEVRRAMQVGLAKLGATAPLDDAPWESRVPAPPALLPVLAATGRHALEIGYTNAAGEHGTRVVHPWAVRCTEDHWYVRAWDERRGSPRTFKLDRMDPAPAIVPDTTYRPAPDMAAAEAALEAGPWAWGDAEPHEVVMRLEGARVDRLLPDGAVLEEDDGDGAQVARMPVRDDDNFASTVLRLGQGATVVSPEATRGAVAARLDATIDALAADAPPTPVLRPRRMRSKQPKADLAHTERLLRLIGIAQAARDVGFEVDTLCSMLQCDAEALRDDMALLTHWCGVPPFESKDMVEAIKVEGKVHLVSTKLELTASLTEWEVAALAVGVRLALEVEPDVDTRALLGGILEALGVEPGTFAARRPQVDVVATAGTAAGTLADAISLERQCEIEHWRPGREAPRRRVVDPWRLDNARGLLYLTAHDHDSDDVRMFRVDRISEVRVLDSPICHPQDVDLPPEANRLTGPGDVEVVVSLPDDHVAWACSRYGADAVRDSPDAGPYLVLPTGDPERLAPTLLALMPRCEVVAPPEARDAVAALARDLRARYR